MFELDGVQKKVLALCHNGEYEKAWLYWKMMGYDYSIFLGEVPASEVITGDTLAEAIGLTAGTTQNSDEPWLKFLLKNELIYVSLKPLRYGVIWGDIYQSGAVYGTEDYGLTPSGCNKLQDAKVMIGDDVFKVTLLKGADDGVNPTPEFTSYSYEWTFDSEWDKLLYPIHTGTHNLGNLTHIGKVPCNRWASYSDEDLIIHYKNGNGSYSWMQETYGNGNDLQRLGRGLHSIINAHKYPVNAVRNIYLGWRPALRRKVF